MGPLSGPHTHSGGGGCGGGSRCRDTRSWERPWPPPPPWASSSEQAQLSNTLLFPCRAMLLCGCVNSVDSTGCWELEASKTKRKGKGSSFEQTSWRHACRGCHPQAQLCVCFASASSSRVLVICPPGAAHKRGLLTEQRSHAPGAGQQPEVGPSPLAAQEGRFEVVGHRVWREELHPYLVR